jgi:hypothetical protein
MIKNKHGYYIKWIIETVHEWYKKAYETRLKEVL